MQNEIKEQHDEATEVEATKVHEGSRDRDNEIGNDGVIIQVKNINKLYGYNRAEAMQMMSEGKCKDEVHRKTGVVVALWDVSFNVRRGEIFVIIGLSGSGKSSLIRCVNMLNKPTSGSILFEGRAVEKMSNKELLEYRRNHVSMVFQSFGLMSNLDVMGNVAFGLEVKGISREQREKKALEMIEMVGLSGYEHEPIFNLSGGMRQRVGIARALATDSDVLLMDEPFSALDPLVRNDMQFELLSIQRKLKKTIVFITHDINEAFKLGDTVTIMRDAKIVQTDTPERMSAAPADDYVKKFIDSADKTKVLSVKHVMMKPSCIVRVKDHPGYAITLMRRHELSSSYVIDDAMRYIGILTLDGAVNAHNSGMQLGEVLIKDVPTATEDSLISDVLPLAAEAKFPIAVVDSDQRLKGIVSRASVISSMI